MKILILYSDINLRSILLNWIEQNTRHIAIAEDFDDVALSVACFEPDIVLLPRYSEDQVLFPNVGFCQLPEDFATEIGSDHPLPQLFKHAERIQRLLRIPAHGYAGNSLRVILSTEVSYSNPKETPRAVRRTLDGGNQYEEAAKLLHQLQVASQHNRHERARRYLFTLRRFDRGLQLEMAPGLNHGSNRLAELRDQTARWLTVLAHYLEGVELQYCPKPQHASAEIAYVHPTMPAAHRYVIFNVLRIGILPGITKQLLAVLNWEPGTLGDESEVGCRLLGLNCYLAQMATAQVKVMEELLYSEIAFDPENQVPRVLQRQFDLFCDFWGFDELGSSCRQLRAILDSHKSRTVQVTHPIPSLTFEQFLAKL